MCGRYALTTPPDVLKALLNLHWMRYEMTPRWNIAPTQRIAAVRSGSNGERELVGLHWGLIPSWAKDRTIASRLINARSETADTTASFRSAFKQRRCLIPASGFYEWKKQRDSKTKQPYYIRPENNKPLAFAGLWESWVDKETGEAIESCTILTKDANNTIRSLHDRMPVMLEGDAIDEWLDQKQKDVAQLKSVLENANIEKLEFHPVSARVNTPRNDDAKLVESVEPAGDVAQEKDEGTLFS